VLFSLRETSQLGLAYGYTGVYTEAEVNPPLFKSTEKYFVLPNPLAAGS
jgi:hypothetical protein